MSGRPVVWMHRTRRFWLGLFGLVALTGLWVASCHVSSYVLWERPASKSMSGGAGGSDHVQVYRCTVGHGALVASYGEGVTDPIPASGWFDVKMDARDAGFTGVSGFDFRVGRHHCNLGMPLWLLPAGWAILWPLWLYRGDVKERKQFGGGHP